MSWLRGIIDGVITSLIAAIVVLEISVRAPRFIDRTIRHAALIYSPDECDELAEEWLNSVNGLISPIARLFFALDKIAGARRIRARRARFARAMMRAQRAQSLKRAALDLFETVVGLWPVARRRPSYGIKGLGWFLVGVIVAPACYIVTSQVAAAREQLHTLDVRIADERKEIRRQETEFVTRANFAALEKWSDQLHLSEPSEEHLCTDNACVEMALQRDENRVATALARKGQNRRHVPRGS